MTKFAMGMVLSANILSLRGDFVFLGGEDMFNFLGENLGDFGDGFFGDLESLLPGDLAFLVGLDRQTLPRFPSKATHPSCLHRSKSSRNCAHPVVGVFVFRVSFVLGEALDDFLDLGDDFGVLGDLGDLGDIGRLWGDGLFFLGEVFFFFLSAAKNGFFGFTGDGGISGNRSSLIFFIV